MSICTIQLPIVRIFKDFDKMSEEQQYIAMDGDDVEDVTESDDQRCIIKFVDTTFGQPDGSISSNEEDAVTSTKPMRQRKRSMSNAPYKMSKAFSESHTQCDDCNTNTFHHNCNSKRVNASCSAQMTSSPSGSGLRKHVLVRRSPSPSVRDRNPVPNKMPLMRHISVGLSPGYAQYQMDLLEVPMPRDYGDASSDDLSSEWDSDVQETHRTPKVFIISNPFFVSIKIICVFSKKWKILENSFHAEEIHLQSFHCIQARIRSFQMRFV